MLNRIYKNRIKITKITKTETKIKTEKLNIKDI